MIPLAGAEEMAVRTRAAHARLVADAAAIVQKFVEHLINRAAEAANAGEWSIIYTEDADNFPWREVRDALSALGYTIQIGNAPSVHVSWGPGGR
jgi:hypothetical protein